ncbi:MAG: cobalamin biosynthesis protein CobW [Paracoccaceae bacterium]|nr:MAG: cobalamin biosynthesis protein CobW [Paracoccaceae bacterium]
MTEPAPPDPAPPEGGAITVNVLTGFLGSGKTHLLNRLLRLTELGGVAVLINEFGEVGLDHLLVEALDDEVVLLASGCVCCSIRGDLKEALIGLHDRMRRGLVPPFDRVVLETTGLADPGPIVATLTADPVLCHHFRLGNIVTVVDALAGLHNLDAHPEALHQAAVADRLVISKTDMAAPDRLEALRTRLRAINPAAEVIESGADSPVPATLLVSDIHRPGAREAEVARWLAAEGDGAGHGHHHHHHDGSVRAFVLSAGAPLDWAAFGLWLSMLLNRHGTRILRVKGLLDIRGVDSPVVIHGVQHTIHRPEHLAAWPDGDRRTRLVFIVDGLDPALIRRSFSAFVTG